LNINHLKSTIPFITTSAGNLYTYCHETLGHYSLIDYIFVSDKLFADVVSAEIKDSGLNFSDHLPVILHVTANSSVLHKSVADQKSRNSVNEYKLRWDKADLQLYYDYTYILLNPVKEKLDFYCNVQCSESVIFDTSVIEDLYNDIISALISADTIVPRAKCSMYKFWWNSHLDSLKEHSLQAFRCWEVLGKPRFGDVFMQMKRSKLQFKTAIRSYERSSEDAFSDELTDALTSKGLDAFWKCGIVNLARESHILA